MHTKSVDSHLTSSKNMAWISYGKLLRKKAYGLTCAQSDVGERNLPHDLSMESREDNGGFHVCPVSGRADSGEKELAPPDVASQERQRWRLVTVLGHRKGARLVALQPGT